MTFVVATSASVKVIGANGQISLGWLHQPHSASSLQDALAWAQNHPPADDNIEGILGKLYNQE
jgi:hypothetical protein